ncbi:hypothetical protein JGS22_010155 [Streptomyces sp. P38-E01]|uniref:Uncharacterized protein n=1 Tax=Streptomyces tardus TaxID=2780544 RepID=A0A949JDB2_9ACTN|nr:hypothetical protein [Streptomyces tardus]MBU7597968.1 hypothetical protein [Streptomyces tardus]
MNQPPSPADEYETHYRYEITTAMNHVVRACQDVVRHHSYGDNWTPKGTPDPMAPAHRELIAQARQDVLNQLQLSIQAAETIAYEIERHRHRITRNRSE